jgi:galactokinase
MRQQVIEAFQNVYQHPAHFITRAPGRANLIGEHTDYHDGFVMPLAVDRAVYVAFAPRQDDLLNVHSLDFERQSVRFTLDQLQNKSIPHWARYVQGAWWLLQHQGYALRGADMVIGSDVPLGGGMSSSAAIGVAMIETALALLQSAKAQHEKALLAVEIEHQYMGVPCGVLDQMASAAALDHSAMLLDCRSLEAQPVPIPDDVSILVMNTMKTRLLAEGGYAKRREESESANPILGTPSLREADLALLNSHKNQLSDVQYRRARHVITENARCLAMKPTLEAGDLAYAGELLNASHASLRDDYEVSVFELDVMSGLAQAHPACYGARMMGGGFGGCAIGLVQTTGVDDLIATIQPRYTEQTGLTPEFYICQPAAGSSVEVVV